MLNSLNLNRINILISLLGFLPQAIAGGWRSVPDEMGHDNPICVRLVEEMNKFPRICGQAAINASKILQPIPWSSAEATQHLDLLTKLAAARSGVAAYRMLPPGPVALSEIAKQVSLDISDGAIAMSTWRGMVFSPKLFESEPYNDLGNFQTFVRVTYKRPVIQQIARKYCPGGNSSAWINLTYLVEPSLHDLDSRIDIGTAATLATGELFAYNGEYVIANESGVYPITHLTDASPLVCVFKNKIRK